MRTSVASGLLGILLSSCGGGSPPADDAWLGPDAVASVDAYLPPDAGPGDAGPMDTGRDARIVPPDAVVRIDATRPVMGVYTYVVSRLLAEPAADGALAGIDVDGIDSGLGGGTGGCVERQRDYTSVVRGTGGIDNQVSANLLETLRTFGVDINGNLRAYINAGVFLIGITVSDLDDFVDDTDGVEVRVQLLQTSSGARPVVDASGVIVAGQRYQVVRDLGLARAATLRGNRLTLDIGDLPIPLFEGDDIPLRRAQLTARISEMALFDGETGGGARVEEIAAFADRMGLGTPARTILRMYADLEPSAVTPTSCDQISAGFRLDAVRGVID